MKLREFGNRFQDGHITGAVIYFPEQGRELALRYYSEGLAWFMQPDDYLTGSGKLIMLEMSVETLMKGDKIYLRTAASIPGNPLLDTELRVETITHIKEGDGSPYPIVTANGQYKWDEI